MQIEFVYSSIYDRNLSRLSGKKFNPEEVITNSEKTLVRFRKVRFKRLGFIYGSILWDREIS
jgi:hypothetical protein